MATVYLSPSNRFPPTGSSENSSQLPGTHFLGRRISFDPFLDGFFHDSFFLHPFFENPSDRISSHRVRTLTPSSREEGEAPTPPSRVSESVTRSEDSAEPRTRRVPSMKRYPSFLDEISKITLTTLKNVQSFYLEHKEELLDTTKRVGKSLAGAVIVSFYAKRVPPLFELVTQLVLLTLANNALLFIAIGKVTFCAAGILFGLSLIFSEWNQVRSEEIQQIATEFSSSK